MDTGMEHDPDPRFVEHLEWQLARALRRRERFARPESRGHWRVARTALLVGVSLLGGAGAVVAAERLQDSRERELLLARANVELELATARLDHAREVLGRAEELHREGFVSGPEVVERRGETEELERRVRAIELDLDEIRASGAPPRRELSAPPVRGRDFVTERLALERTGLEEALERARLDVERERQLVEHGVASGRELRAAEDERAALDESLELLLRRMDLRSGFLRGEHRADELVLLEEEARTASELAGVLRAIELGRRELRRVEQLEAAGRAANESGAIRLDLKVLEGSERLLELELKTLREKLGRPR